MKTRCSVRAFGRILRRSECLWLLLALAGTLGVIKERSYAQNCAECPMNADLDVPVSSGEWLLTKQVNEVNVIFVAAHKGKPIGDLSQADIAVQDDNKPASILRFRTESALPLRVGVAIDTSNSVTSRFRFEQDAASAFFRQAVNPDRDLGFVLGFENHPKVMQDFVGDPELLAQGVEHLKIGGGTALYDAIHTACQKLLHHPEEQDMVARVLVVVSDGQNNAGEMSMQRAIDAAQEAEVTIYAISTNYPGASYAIDYDAQLGNSNLRKLAEQTGGRVMVPRSPKEVTKAFAKIGEELRSRYAVAYKPSDFTPDGHYRTIKIEARKTGEKLEIRARKGYYARAASWLSEGSKEEEASAASVR
jgi:Ca-activated chloride channel homolog